QIQNEKNYRKFEELMREVTALMSAKKSRFPESKLAPAGAGQKILRATAGHTIKPLTPSEIEKVELHLTDADPLYSEIRIENCFVDDCGNTLAVKPNASLDVKLQAPAHHFALRPPR